MSKKVDFGGNLNRCWYLPCCSDNIPDDEWNLMYVAVTRAKTTLIITKTIRRILTVAGVSQDHAISPHPACLCRLSTFISWTTLVQKHILFFNPVSPLAALNVFFRFYKDTTSSFTQFPSVFSWYRIRKLLWLKTSMICLQFWVPFLTRVH